MLDLSEHFSVRVGIFYLVYNSVVNFPPANALSSRELCLSKVCSGCIAGSLSCQEGGLSRLPDQLSADIQSVILIGHRFDSSSLLKANFSNYPHQTTQLQRLTLRNCGVERVQPGAFHSLQTLTQLDLSQNNIQIIESHTFAGLRLEFLRLDENKGLRLAPGAFEEASIVSLSMNQCGLRTLSYEDLAPLLKNGVLTNLHLSGNKLMSLESRLEPTFLVLQSLSIEQNSFVCDCKIRWLADVLRQRSVKRDRRGLGTIFNDDSTHLSGRPFNSALDVRPGTQLDGDLLKPVCRSPERLAGRWIEKLTAQDFYCSLPNLQTLEIDLSYVDGPDQEAAKAVQQKGNAPVKRDELKVTLRCHVSGSPELQIAWYRRSGSQMMSRLGLHGPEEDLTKLSSSKSNKPGVTEVELFSPQLFQNNALKNSIALGIVPIERLVCFASDLSGNSSAEVRLHWPLPVTTQNAEESIQTSPVEQSYPMAETTQLEKEKKTDKNGWIQNTEERSHWYLLTGEDPNGFWLQKQFSALQMIGAVVGTFTITLFLFLIGFCLLKAYRVNRTCERNKLFLQNNASVYNQSSPTSKYTGLPSYSSVPIQPNASMYPVVASSSMDVQNLYSSHLPHQLTNHVSQNDMSALDLSGNKRLPYATYEPVPLSELAAPTTYSDSQTYDVPRFPSILSPPSMPLPPVPASTNSSFISTQTMDPRPTFITSTLGGHGTAIRGQISGSVMSPLLGNKSDGGTSREFPMSATLNRLHNSAHLQGHSTLNQHQNAQQLAQNQLFNFVNQPSAFNLHAQEKGS
ncbi:hypothetical protein T265_02844 [Opisthorchis viverrini]|uniref:Ig-like domain-containing protein n=1 Tax=Opisthorchis viverrini TaxID=6198 RepID=A0A075A5C9_OPIVI|nr:hypothetical protein T265_02844 [Opisthorchis viverrini]KER30805.1 hypothetical protein T265_02844 [Opisthorchis viverrini]